MLKSEVPGVKINGMLAYAVKKGDDQAFGTRVGTYEPGTDTKLKANCNGPSLTHKNGDDKDGLSFTWTAPPPGLVTSQDVFFTSHVMLSNLFGLIIRNWHCNSLWRCLLDCREDVLLSLS